MKDVTLKNGEVMTDAQFVEMYGDTLLTDFVATKEDLKLLVDALVKERLDNAFFLGLSPHQALRSRDAYADYRLERVLDFVPELKAETENKLRSGYAKVEKEVADVIAKAKAEEAEEK